MPMLTPSPPPGAASGGPTATINGAGPYPCTVERDVSNVPVLSATRPDPAWSYVDAAGHYHAWSDSALPTLESVTVPCDCDPEDCDGDGISEWRCRICGELVEPGMLRDLGPHTVPVAGPTPWAVVVRGAGWSGADLVSVVVRAGGRELFGVAQFAGATAGDDVCRFVGVGELGRRTLAATAGAPQ